MDSESLDLDISLTALDLEELRNGIGNTSFNPLSKIGHSIFSIFHDEMKMRTMTVRL